MKQQRRDTIVVCFFGDGATEEGVFYESLNFAALKAVPVIFVCENNGYAIHTSITKRQKLANLTERARAFGLTAERVPPHDTLRLHELASEAAHAIRTQSAGPFFLECPTYRWKEHVGPNEDFNLGYRSRAEAGPWIENDEVARFAGRLDPAERQAIESAVEQEIADAFKFAEESPFPGAMELCTDIFKAA